MTDAVSEVRELIGELVGSMRDDVVQQRKNADGSTTSYVVRTRQPLMARVHELLEPGPGAPRDRPGKTSRKKPTAPLPVAADAFNVIVVVEGGIRELEHLLRQALNLPSTFRDDPRGLDRPHTGAHAYRAMHEVADLLEHLARTAPEHPLVTGPPHNPDKPHARKPGRVLREVRAWHRAASTIVGFRQEWARLRYVAVKTADSTSTKPRFRLRRVGCPYCKATSLKQRPRDGAVVCCNPTCKTPTESRAEWPAEELERLGLVLTADKPEGETA